uniref:RecQ-mediated genome instability protein 1 n=1 Tax=Setaria digitata TaxID=48799 RepID=A0A915PQN8_9BILA
MESKYSTDWYYCPDDWCQKMKEKQGMSMTDAKKASVAELFSNFHVTLKEAWLNEVLEYIHVERGDVDMALLRQLIYEQWLYSELSNSTRPMIRLSPFQKKTSLDRNAVVQINWLVDVHTSMYSKLRECVGHTTDNSFFHWEPNDETQDLEPKNRMYLMEVTDGQRKLRAVEYQKIDNLCEKLPPGTKLLIFGGTICRRNVLLLTSNNTVLLGGESEMCQQNAPAFILSRRLGIDEKKKKSLLTRTITSYFQPQRKTTTFKSGLEISTKPQVSLAVQEVKVEPEIQYLPRNPLRKREKQLEAAPAIELKQELRHTTPATAFSNLRRESNESLAVLGQSDPSVLAPCIFSVQKMDDSIKESCETVEKQASVMLCQSQDAQDISASSQSKIGLGKASLSNELQTGNLETALSFARSPRFPIEKKNESRILRGENEQGETTAKPLVPAWDSDLQKQTSDTNFNAAIISSSNISEPTTWTTNLRRYIVSENSKQFLANEFHFPTAKEQIQTSNGGNTLPIDSAAFYSQLNLLQNSSLKATPWRNGSASDSRSEGCVFKSRRASCVSFQPNRTSCHSNLLLPVSTGDLRKIRVSSSQSFQENSAPFPVPQNLFTSSKPQRVPEQSMCCNTSVENRATTLAFPDATVRIIPHPIFCKLRAGLQFIGQRWTAALRIADETCDALDCLVDSGAISDLIGFTPREAQQASANSDRVRVEYYKGRAQAMIETFKRLDLVLTIEFSSSSDVLPLIVHITNLSTALGLC